MDTLENYSFYNYLTATTSYALLIPFALISIKKSPYFVPFFLAIVLSLIWLGYTTFTLQDQFYFSSDALPFETLRNGAWLIFLCFISFKQRKGERLSIFFRSKNVLLILFSTTLVFLYEVNSGLLQAINQFLQRDLRLFIHVIFAIVGLMLIEQIYRNAFSDQRWSIKFLCVGLGALFIVDFILYSKSLLFFSLDSAIWSSRGIINAIIAPMLAVSMLRLQEKDTELTVSRKIVFHTTVLFGSGLYLVLMSVAGFYIRDYGGNWGEVAQFTFIFLAILLLIVLFISGKIRALVKVNLSKHFLEYRYDYREEWIKLSKTLAQLNSVSELAGLIIKTMADLVESSGGGLWLKNEQGDFYLAEHKHLGFEPEQLFGKDEPFIRFLADKQWVIDFVQYIDNPDLYDDIDLSKWNFDDNKIWLIIPLYRLNSLEAFVVLTQARVPRALNWEDLDLLKTVGFQLSNALALNQTLDELSRARQFEAYSRLSAFVVHDLKNLIAQVAMIVKNAEKHKHNPEFIEDSIDTLQNVVTKMQHIIDQLKKGNIQSETQAVLNLNQIIQDVAQQQSSNRPTLEIVSDINQDFEVQGEQAKITAVLGHLIQNAQEATDDDGFVKLELTQNADRAIIKIIDSGAGMDNKFIAERLFKPFDTTKGNAGMGIGVYEARDYVLKHSGTIDVKSAAGIGTTFTITLPLYKRHKQPTQTSAETNVQLDMTRAILKGEK
ncbi:XrtA/PEP-CTERM system histidine kinase PrsK [Methylotuvimicrobium buryatense]|uniref:XrtA/PEP-CTERM system histidine kinase PrsK n=1 Tax=Methylotuvimicrobium buryatense TaxID=95641 RepID=UPI00034869A1|nr:XrtA/PEP-CTERM system histidine kinase PrsK [Methylotuvimicrobium buryatense]